MNNEPDYDNLYFERKPMTQKIFDTDNAEDMALLWSILPESITKLTPTNTFCITSNAYTFIGGIIEINWHDKTEITRPIQEATEADVGKLCVFWNDANQFYYGVLTFIGYSRETPYYKTNVDGGSTFDHCRRLTKQEIEELI